MAGCGSRMTAVRCGADTVGGSGAASHSCGPSPHPATPALQVELPGAGRAAVLRRVWSTGHLRFLPGAGPARAGVLRRACAGLCACRWSCTGTLCRRAAAPRGCPRRCRSPRPCPPLPMHSHPPPRTGTGTGTGDAEPHDPGAGGPSGHHHHSHPLLRTLPPGWRAAGVLQGLPWGCAGGAQGTAGARLACLPMCQQAARQQAQQARGMAGGDATPCSRCPQIEGDRAHGKMSPLVRLGTQKATEVGCGAACTAAWLAWSDMALLRPTRAYLPC